MSQLGCMLRVSVFAFCGMLVIHTLAYAQPAPAAAAAAPEPRSGPETATPDAKADDTDESLPVFAITSVEVLRSAHTQGLDIIVARGLTTSDGWEGGELVPLTRGTPADGVLDLVFVAKAPDDTSAPSSYAPILAALPVPNHPYKAIRVRSATNAVTLKTLPGYIETAAPGEPCGPCVGKLFVAKGAAMPSGVASGDVVHEEELPANARILRPTDGVAELRANPNRLTIVVGEDGRIVDAVWE